MSSSGEHVDSISDGAIPDCDIYSHIGCASNNSLSNLFGDLPSGGEAYEAPVLSDDACLAGDLPDAFFESSDADASCDGMFHDPCIRES